MNMPLILAGDVGGTKTWLGLFDCNGVRPTPVETAHYATQTFDGLLPLVTGFVERTGAAARIEAATFGVAGPVRDNAARLTNVPWHVDGATMAARLGIDQVRILNDLEAMAHAVPYLEPHELAVVRPGAPRADGNAALIAPGTGLGEACLHAVDGRLLPVPSEAGHTDFAARTPRELQLVSVLTAAGGRVQLEDVVSGPGLVTLHRFTHRTAPCARPLPRNQDVTPAVVTAAALSGACSACVEALDLFVAALGAEAGNLALRTLSSAGLYVGGGIAPGILPALRSDRFRDAFVAKGAMRPLLEPIPVSVIIEPQAALIGAAVHAGRSASIRRTSRK